VSPGAASPGAASAGARSGGAGFIGLGQIGRVMAARLVDAPGGLWIHDIDAAAVAALEKQGAQAAASPRALTEQVSHVSIMVRDDAQVRAVLDGPEGVLAGARPGCVVAVHSTIHPDTARELAARAERADVHLLDAPVSGGVLGATQGRLAILVGGPRAAFDASRSVLERMGDLVVHVGAVGAGTAAKVARNLVHFVSFTAVGEALALAEAAGIDLLTLGQVVRHTDAITGGPGAMMWRGSTAPPARDDPWFGILDHVRELGEKDLELAADLAGRLDVPIPLGELARQRLAASLGLTSEGDA
jgi:3-hydroxyisobutyrate dehydrogenase-like beta-hydroxyacid dehydrogenase